MEDAARTTMRTMVKKEKENEEEVMSTTTITAPAAATAPANVNIDDTKDYFQKRIISKFEGTRFWSIVYFVIYLIGMIFILHKIWVRMIIITIPFSWVFELSFRSLAETTWERLQSFLMISPSSTTRRTSMSDVHNYFVHLYPLSALFIFIHVYIVLGILPPQMLKEEGPGSYAILYSVPFLFVLVVLTIRNHFKMIYYLIAFERRVQQSSATTDHRRATYCKCKMPPSASASDWEWIQYYIVEN